MTRLRREDGFTLMEVMVAASLLIVVIGATLGTMTQFSNTTRANQLSNDAQESARVAVDQLARELRNDGVGTAGAPQGVRLVSAKDLVFQTVASTMPSGSANLRNVKFVRYCLDTTDPSNEKLWRQDYTWTSASPPASIPATTSCPGATWNNTHAVADQLFNYSNGQSRPIFSTNASLTRIGITAYVNANRGGAANAAVRETRLDSAVALRDENGAPTASFTSVVENNGHVLLNASASSDPESDPLTYQWYYDGIAIPDATDVTLDYQPKPFSGTHTIKVTVTDAGGLTDSATQTVSLG
jgi:type II secretory pathway pseudopilin PulG